MNEEILKQEDILRLLTIPKKCKDDYQDKSNLEKIIKEKYLSEGLTFDVNTKKKIILNDCT